MNTSTETTGIIQIQPISIDLTPIIEHGDSPTALIIAMTLFTGVLLSSLKKLK